MQGISVNGSVAEIWRWDPDFLPDKWWTFEFVKHEAARSLNQRSCLIVFSSENVLEQTFLKDSLTLLSYQTSKKICFLSQNLCKIQVCFLGLDVICLAYTCLCYGFNNRAFDTLVNLKAKICFQICLLPAYKVLFAEAFIYRCTLCRSLMTRQLCGMTACLIPRRALPFLVTLSFMEVLCLP